MSAMSTEDPQVGQISTDGSFLWDGAAWTPLARNQREPTSWTQPLRRAVAAYLLLAAVLDIVTNAVVSSVSTLETALRSANPDLAADQVHSQATVAYAASWVFVVVVAAIYVAVAVGSLRGWRWAFWVSLVVLALRSIGVVTSGLALTSSTARTPAWASAMDLALAVVALALLVWLIVAAARFGPWAMRRSGGRLPAPR
jgi:hypothetical protein